MKKSMSALFLAVALVVTLGSADESSSEGSSPTTAASGGSDGGSDTTAAGGGEAGEGGEVDDVTITACGEVDAAGFTKATIDVVNNSSQPSNYLIEVVFESADGATQLATGNAYITSLGAGQTKTEEVSTLETIEEQGITCRLASVERLAA